MVMRIPQIPLFNYLKFGTDHGNIYEWQTRQFDWKEQTNNSITVELTIFLWEIFYFSQTEFVIIWLRYL